jgi:type IV pilus assembly protein PilN
MRVSLNLASRPFVELGPLYTRLRIFIALLAVVAVPLWLLLSTENRKAALAQGRLDAVNQKIQALEAQRAASQAEMRQPQNAAVLTQSEFLNQMFLRKSFSWTAVMMDLENVLPSGVQVMNIDPVPAKDGTVTIRLRVSGAHERAVDLIRNLEHSHRFIAPRVARETAESNQNRGSIQQVSAVSNVNFDLVAEYNPLPDKSEKHAAEGAKTPAKKAAKTPSKAVTKIPKPRPARKAAAQ